MVYYSSVLPDTQAQNKFAHSSFLFFFFFFDIIHFLLFYNAVGTSEHLSNSNVHSSCSEHSVSEHFAVYFFSCMSFLVIYLWDLTD